MVGDLLALPPPSRRRRGVHAGCLRYSPTPGGNTRVTGGGGGEEGEGGGRLGCVDAVAASAPPPGPSSPAPPPLHG